MGERETDDHGVATDDHGVALSSTFPQQKAPSRRREKEGQVTLGRSLLYAANAAKDVHSCADALPRKRPTYPSEEHGR